MTFDPKSVEVTCVTLPKDHCFHIPWKYIKACGYSDPFFKTLNQRSLTPRWPLTPHLLRSRVWLFPQITVSKSHGIASMYVDTVINFAKYHIHTTYILHTTYRMSDHSLFLNTVQVRQKKELHQILDVKAWPMRKQCVKCKNFYHRMWTKITVVINGEDFRVLLATFDFMPHYFSFLHRS